MSDTLTVTEAATMADVSVRTVRRWIKNGHIVTVGRGHDRRVVTASLLKHAATSDTDGQQERPPGDTGADTTDTKTATGDNRDAGGHEADRLADLVRELSARLADQAAVAAMWQERARVLGDQLALMPPQANEAGQPEPQSTTASAEPARRYSVLWWLLAGATIAAVSAAVAYGLLALVTAGVR